MTAEEEKEGQNKGMSTVCVYKGPALAALWKLTPMTTVCSLYLYDFHIVHTNSEFLILHNFSNILQMKIFLKSEADNLYMP